MVAKEYKQILEKGARASKEPPAPTILKTALPCVSVRVNQVKSADPITDAGTKWNEMFHSQQYNMNVLRARSTTANMTHLEALQVIQIQPV